MFEVGEMLSHYSSSHESTTNYSDSQGLAGRLGKDQNEVIVPSLYHLN